MKPSIIPQVPKGILVKFEEVDILLKPHLIHREGSTGSSYYNPVEQIHSKKISPSKTKILRKAVNFILPHTTIRIEGTLEDNKITIKIPRKIQFHNKVILSNDDLKTALCNRSGKENVGNLGFLKKKYGKRTSIEAASDQKRFKKEIEMVHPLPQKQMPLATLFKKSSPKRFNWKASLTRPIKQASPPKTTTVSGISNEAPLTGQKMDVPLPETVTVSGLFMDVSTPVKPLPNGSQYNTPDTVLKEFEDFKPLIIAPLLSASDDSLELNGSEILDYYDFQEISETSTPTQSIIKNDLQQPLSPIYSENSFFQDEQSFISQAAYDHNMDPAKSLTQLNDFSSAKSTPSRKERQAPLSPPKTPKDNLKKTVIDVSGIEKYSFLTVRY